MTKQFRDLAIGLLCAHLIAGFWIVLAMPTELGNWRGQYEIGFDQVWGEYISDCDCTEVVN